MELTVLIRNTKTKCFVSITYQTYLPQIPTLHTSINERFSKNSEETFDKSKTDYYKALKDSGFQQA